MKNTTKVTNFGGTTIQVPRTNEITGRQWVSFGDNNNFPDFIAGLYHQSSSIHATCIDAKVDAAIGKGLCIEGTDSTFNLNANPYETWDEVFEKVMHDYTVHGNFALNVIWNVTGDKIVEIYHIDWTKVRYGKKDADDHINEIWYAPNWGRVPYKKWVNPVCYPAFSQQVALQAAKEKNEYGLSQIYTYSDYTTGFDYYALPSYKIINHIQTLIQISAYDLSNISNGLMPSVWVNMNNGVPKSDEESDSVTRQLNNEFSGAQNAGKLIVTFSDNKETAPEITPLQTTNDNVYTEKSDKLIGEILSAHKITSPLLLGIRDGSGGLSSNAEEIKTQYGIFLFNTIEPLQKPVLKAFNKLWRLSGYTGKLCVMPRVIFADDTLVKNTENKTAE
jgi:hypothetical protein